LFFIAIDTVGLVGQFETVIVVAYDCPVLGLDILEKIVVGDTVIFSTAACDRETAWVYYFNE
jgi:hypothetical protein